MVTNEEEIPSVQGSSLLLGRPSNLSQGVSILERAKGPLLHQADNTQTIQLTARRIQHLRKASMLKGEDDSFDCTDEVVSVGSSCDKAS